MDGTAQIIVAHELTPSMSDQGQLTPLADGVEHNLGRRPKEVSADAGYCSEANLQALADRGVSAYIAQAVPSTPMANGEGPAARLPRR